MRPASENDHSHVYYNSLFTITYHDQSKEHVLRGRKTLLFHCCVLRPTIRFYAVYSRPDGMLLGVSIMT